MKRIITLMLMVVINTLAVFSQNPDKATQALNNGSFVFKGIVTTYKAFKLENDETVYASYIIKIDTIYKGERLLKSGTVELITKAPFGWDVFEDGSWGKDSFDEVYDNDDFDLASGVPSLFVCNEKIGNWQKSSVSVDNKVILEPICNTLDCFFKYNNTKHFNKESKNYYSTFNIRGFGRVFKTRDAFYKYLKEQGLTPQNLKYKKKDIGSVKKKDNHITYAERIKNYNNYENYILSLRNKTSNKNINSNEDISFEIKNEHVTGTSPKFFEFDIFVSGGSNETYFDNSAFVLQYNSIPFGDSISLNNNVIITAGTNYSSTTYVDPMVSISDHLPNAVRFGIGTGKSLLKILI